MDPDPMSPGDPRPEGFMARHRRGAFETILIVAVALSLAFAIQAWAVKPYEIPTGSMEPTLDVGQRILVNRFIYHVTDPEVGDIVVFHPPSGAEEALGGECGAPMRRSQACSRATEREASTNFVKRLVAGPGDRVRIIHGQAIVNGKVSKAANGAINTSCGRPAPRSRWSRAGSGGGCNFPKPIVIPRDHYFFMGDNRGHSDDSRFWGPVPRSWIVGRAFATYWPPNRLGIF